MCPISLKGLTRQKMLEPLMKHGRVFHTLRKEVLAAATCSKISLYRTSGRMLHLQLLTSR